MRNTKAFKEAVAETLAELARRGVTLAPATVEDIIERNVQAVAAQLGIQVRSAWRYFDASVLADSLAQSVREFEASSPDGVTGGGASMSFGKAPLPGLG
ncbi:hypothetical protein ACFV2H_52270 [Streptomyces sp. NPDC059629]|uniref:hypothetical protein n=1 Tax=Streptomyces sp. NPDC059629 TaxID=3346889 RepID=UPI0036BCD90E